MVDEIPDQLDTLAREYYMFLVDNLKSAEILSNLDIPMLTQTADTLSKMQQADEILAKEGIIWYKFDNAGNQEPKEHPMVGTKQKYLTQFRALSTQLGLSPSSRAGLAELNMQKEVEAKDPVLSILNNIDNE